MKKYLSLVLIALPIIACAKDPNVKSYCNSTFKIASPGWTPIASQHGVTIINKSPNALVYDVYFDNAIQYPKVREMPLDYSEAPYTPNAHAEYHFKIEAGKTFYYGQVNVEKIAGFQKKGIYRTKASTIIKYNGVLLDNCQYFNTIEIN